MTPLYHINLAPAAQRQLKKLVPSARNNIIKRLELLKTDPQPEGSKKLAGTEKLYRLRVGNYRVIYTLNHKQLVILVVKIGDRKEIYRHLNGLK